MLLFSAYVALCLINVTPHYQEIRSNTFSNRTEIKFAALIKKKTLQKWNVANACPLFPMFLSQLLIPPYPVLITPSHQNIPRLHHRSSPNELCLHSPTSIVRQNSSWIRSQLSYDWKQWISEQAKGTVNNTCEMLL